jgi:hypothetical protein
MPLISAFPISNNQIKLEPVTGVAKELLPQYLSAWRNWMQSGSIQFSGFEQYQHAAFCHGTVQAFDHFFIKHHSRRMRFFRGEFMYHQVCLRNSVPWCFVEDDKLDKNDAVVVSCPFSDLGDIHPDLPSLLETCDKLNIPVLIDMAYACISKDMHIDLDHPCIETVTTSLSKAFDGAQFLRAGIRWQKQDLDDGIDFFNKNFQVSTNSLALALDYMQKFGYDNNWMIYGDIYEQIIAELDIAPTKCILFGLGDTRFQQYNRGSRWNRVCIAKEIGEKYASMQSQ